MKNKKESFWKEKSPENYVHYQGHDWMKFEKNNDGSWHLLRPSSTGYGYTHIFRAFIK